MDPRHIWRQRFGERKKLIHSIYHQGSISYTSCALQKSSQLLAGRIIVTRKLHTTLVNLVLRRITWGGFLNASNPHVIFVIGIRLSLRDHKSLRCLKCNLIRGSSLRLPVRNPPEIASTDLEKSFFSPVQHADPRREEGGCSFFIP